MVVRQTNMLSLAAAFANDELLVANWITQADGRLRVRREFQIIRTRDEQTLMRAQIDYVCMRLSTGKPTRMPPEYITAYASDLAP